jgi:hypothetical protein
MKTAFSSIGALAALLAGSCVLAQGAKAPLGSGGTRNALQLDFASFLGGSGEDRAHGMAVDGQGNIYLTAPIQSTDFPTTPDALNKTPTGVYLARLSPAGALLYSTFLGAPGGANYAHGVALDKEGCIYVAGNTTNPNFPTTPGALQTSLKGPSNASAAHGDAFVMKLSPAGDHIIYSTFLGGTGPDICGKIAVDAEGNAYVLGATSSKDFPVTSGAFQTTYRGKDDTGHGDIFVAKLSPDGSKLVYCTYVGGSDTDFYGDNLIVDAAGEVHFAGMTTSPDFPVTANALDKSCRGGEDAIFVKLNPAGTALEYASYIGGRGADMARTVAVDNDGNVWLAGDTASADFPTTPDALSRQNKGGTDGFFLKLDPRGGPLLYASLLGGSKDDAAMIALHASGLLILAGRTDSPDFPVTPGAIGTAATGAMDIFISLFDPGAKSLRYSTYFGGRGSDVVGAPICRGDQLYLAGNTTSADFPATSGVWDATYNGGTNPWGGDGFVTRFTLVGQSPERN